MARLLALVLLLALGACAGLSARDAQPAHPLILVSIDGFRADYLQRGRSPNLQALADNGASTAMRPSFPSLTFPNHYALVTGLRPDCNGIVDNTMRDARRPDVVFRLSNRDQANDGFWWDEATPFWVTAERAGMRTGTMFWPGSEAEIHGVRPSHWMAYDHDMTSQARVDQLLAWLDLPAEQRPTAMTLYFDVVDSAGHRSGPDSAEVDAAIADVDTAIGRLREGLKARGLDVNLIIVSDHGMAAVSTERGIFLDDLLPRETYDLVTWGGMAGLNPASGHEAEVDKALIRPHDHMTCWHKADIPARLHYGRNPRVPAIVCSAQSGWIIAVDPAKGIGYTGGAHGYDNLAPDMQALFIASGPDLRPGVRLPPFDNVDVYDLEMMLLHLNPERNDGSLKPLRPALLP